MKEAKNFSQQLNILRAGVLGANDGIISVAGVVIGVASATHNLWIIFLSAASAILAGAFSMAGGEYVSVSTQKDTEQAAVAREEKLLENNPDFPTITILLLPFSVRIVGTVIIVIVSLLSTGYVSAKLGQAPTVPAMRRNVMIGCLTMLATYVIGQLFSI